MVKSLKGTGENPAIASKVIQAIVPPSEEILFFQKVVDIMLMLISIMGMVRRVESPTCQVQVEVNTKPL